jgi:hypothetical protein
VKKKREKKSKKEKSIVLSRSCDGKWLRWRTGFDRRSSKTPTLTIDSLRQDVMSKEAQIMKSLEHENIVEYPDDKDVHQHREILKRRAGQQICPFVSVSPKSSTAQYPILTVISQGRKLEVS